MLIVKRDAGARLSGLSVFIVALLIPLIVVAGNGFVRWLFGSPQSAAADLILAMMVFDATVSIQSHDFSPFVTTEFLKSNLAAIYMGLLFVSFFVWMATAFKLSRTCCQRSILEKSII